jgi:hypothetical protein
VPNAALAVFVVACGAQPPPRAANDPLDPALTQQAYSNRPTL